MKEEIKNVWTKALRSGEYKQGKGKLCRDGKFCCLGILTDLFLKEKKLEWEVNGDVLEYKSRSVSLHRDVMEWSGVSSYNGGIGSYDSLATQNDEGADFPEIANFIDEYWRKL